jgi:1-pyrroline-5-carboxylate dehydrogenase
MGGKDSILVCADADFDAAVDGVVASAFGFSGQKCSACSRAIIEAPLYDVFVERLRERVATLIVGDPTANPNMGPVINQAALDTMMKFIEVGKKESRLIAGGNVPTTTDGGYFLEPTVFADVVPNAALAQEEIFGPVLAVIKVASFEEGLRVANNTEYGLTGSVYTSDPAMKAAARSAFHVGNLYFNRKCTGAMVGAHPFGGFNMSGTDSKAGGPDYLYLFTQAKSVAEKL